MSSENCQDFEVKYINDAWRKCVWIHKRPCMCVCVCFAEEAERLWPCDGHCIISALRSLFVFRISQLIFSYFSMQQCWKRKRLNKFLSAVKGLRLVVFTFDR